MWTIHWLQRFLLSTHGRIKQFECKLHVLQIPIHLWSRRQTRSHMDYFSQTFDLLNSSVGNVRANTIQVAFISDDNQNIVRQKCQIATSIEHEWRLRRILRFTSESLWFTFKESALPSLTMRAAMENTRDITTDEWNYKQPIGAIDVLWPDPIPDDLHNAYTLHEELWSSEILQIQREWWCFPPDLNCLLKICIF